MWYRAQGVDWISRIGYAVSADGIHWNRLRRPVLEPVDAVDSRGVEDPRVVWLDGRYIMTYTAYGRQFTGEGEPTHSGGGDHVIGLATCSLMALLDFAVRGE